MEKTTSPAYYVSEEAHLRFSEEITSIADANAPYDANYHKIVIPFFLIAKNSEMMQNDTISFMIHCEKVAADVYEHFANDPKYQLLHPMSYYWEFDKMTDEKLEKSIQQKLKYVIIRYWLRKIRTKSRGSK